MLYQEKLNFGNNRGKIANRQQSTPSQIEQMTKLCKFNPHPQTDDETVRVAARQRERD